VFEASYTQIWEAIRALVKRAIKSGEIRKDLDPIDLLRALIGVSNVASSPIQLNAPTPPGCRACCQKHKKLEAARHERLVMRQNN